MYPSIQALCNVQQIFSKKKFISQEYEYLFTYKNTYYDSTIQIQHLQHVGIIIKFHLIRWYVMARYFVYYNSGSIQRENLVPSIQIIRMIFKRTILYSTIFILISNAIKEKEIPLRHEGKPIFLSMWYSRDTYFIRDSQRSNNQYIIYKIRSNKIKIF